MKRLILVLALLFAVPASAQVPIWRPPPKYVLPPKKPQISPCHTASCRQLNQKNQDRYDADRRHYENLEIQRERNRILRRRRN